MKNEEIFEKVIETLNKIKCVNASLFAFISY